MSLVPNIGCSPCACCILRTELPCLSLVGPDPGFNVYYLCNCDLEQRSVFYFPGNPATTYPVVIRVRGIIEPKDIVGGTPGITPSTQWFNKGGVAGINTANVYSITVSDPLETYFLNRSYGAQPPGGANYFYFYVDYTVTIQIKGGAQVVLNAKSIDRKQIIDQNSFNQCPGFPGTCAIRPPKEPNLVVPSGFPNTIYHGQFVQVDFDCTPAFPSP